MLFEIQKTIFENELEKINKDNIIELESLIKDYAKSLKFSGMDSDFIKNVYNFVVVHKCIEHRICIPVSEKTWLEITSSN